MAKDDLKKLMVKLKEKKDQKVVDPETPTEEEDLEEAKTQTETPKEIPKETETQDPETPIETKTPLKEVNKDQESIAEEIAVLQNNGIFRRELLLRLTELTDVHKVLTQTLLDLKNSIGGEDGTKKE